MFPHVVKEGGELHLLPEVESNKHHIITVIISCHHINISVVLLRNEVAKLQSVPPYSSSLLSSFSLT